MAFPTIECEKVEQSHNFDKATNDTYSTESYTPHYFQWQTFAQCNSSTSTVRNEMKCDPFEYMLLENECSIAELQLFWCFERFEANLIHSKNLCENMFIFVVEKDAVDYHLEYDIYLLIIEFFFFENFIKTSLLFAIISCKLKKKWKQIENISFESRGMI